MTSDSYTGLSRLLLNAHHPAVGGDTQLLRYNDRVNTAPGRSNLASRVRNIARVKAILALLFLAVVVLTMPNPISIGVGVLDLLCVPAFVLLARRMPRAATYGLILETALALTPRQFVQGYVNGVNWPIYIAIPLIAPYVLRQPGATRVSAALTALVALPVMLTAAITLPPGMKQADVWTLLVFVAGLMIGAAFIVGDLLREESATDA